MFAESQTLSAETQSDQGENGKLLNVGQVATMLGVSSRTVRHWAKIGELPSFKVGHRHWRFSEADIVQYIDNKQPRSSSSVTKQRQPLLDEVHSVHETQVITASDNAIRYKRWQSKDKDFNGRACAALQKLLQLGVSQKEIAAQINVDASTISRIRSLDREPVFSVSERLARNLENLLLLKRRDMAKIALSQLPLKVLETCNNKGVTVNEEVQSEIRQTILASLLNASTSEAPQIPLPDGVNGVIASLGDGLFCIKLQPQVGDSAKDKANHLRVLIHELEHLVQRLHAELPELKKPYQPKSAF